MVSALVHVPVLVWCLIGGASLLAATLLTCLPRPIWEKDDEFTSPMEDMLRTLVREERREGVGREAPAGEDMPPSGGET